MHGHASRENREGLSSHAGAVSGLRRSEQPAHSRRRRFFRTFSPVLRRTLSRCNCAEGCAGSEDPGDFLAVERFALEQRARQRVELFEVLFEDLPRALRAVADDALDLHVDLERGLLAVVLLPRDFPPEENVLLVLAECEGPEFLRHAPLADHLARHLRGLLKIVAGPG